MHLVKNRITYEGFLILLCVQESKLSAEVGVGSKNEISKTVRFKKPSIENLKSNSARTK
jgi:hypothetical protein